MDRRPLGKDRPGRNLAIALGSLFILAFATTVLVLLDEERERPASPDARVAAAGGGHPNFVVVMTDDQTLAEMRALPQTRRLIGGEGATFENFYATNPLCCPSRATLFTGQYAHNHGVISNEGPNAFPAFDAEQTIAVWLRDAGYSTSFIGKYLNGYGEDDPELVPPGWDNWQALIEPSTQNYLEYELNENGSIVEYGPDPREYKTAVIGKLAARSIRRQSNERRPFFVYVGFNAPHAPSTPAPEDAGTQADLDPPASPAFNEADVADKPSFLRDRPPLDNEALARIASRRQRSLESLAAVDRAVARIVNALDRADELDDTYVLFTSDNGYLAGEHRIEFGKLLAYEPSSHLPLLIRGPGIEQRSETEELAGNIDIAKTIVELARAEPGLELDGKLLFGRDGDLLGDAEEGERALLIESLVRDRSTFYGYPYVAVRAGDLILIRYESGEEELYDLAEDPAELDSLAEDPDYAEIKDALGEALDRLSGCAGAECDVRIDPEALAR